MRSALLPKIDRRRSEQRVRVFCYYCNSANWFMDLAVRNLIEDREIVCLDCIAETEIPQAWPDQDIEITEEK